MDASFLADRPTGKTWRIVAARRAQQSPTLVLTDDQGVEHTWPVVSLERHGMQNAREIGTEPVRLDTPWLLYFGSQGYLMDVKLEQVPY